MTPVSAPSRLRPYGAGDYVSGVVTEEVQDLHIGTTCQRRVGEI